LTIDTARLETCTSWGCEVTNLHFLQIQWDNLKEFSNYYWISNILFWTERYL